MQLLHAIVLLESSVVQERFGSLSIVLMAQSSQILSRAHCRICLRAENTKLVVPSVKIVSDAKSYRPKYGLIWYQYHGILYDMELSLFRLCTT